MHMMWLKAICRIEEPLAWKGGTLAELLKGGLACPSKCVSYRGILVSDHGGKKYHSWIRSRFSGLFAKIARQTQHGGVADRGTDLCAHLTRSFYMYTKVAGLSACCIYLDVVGAFDAMIRELLFGGDISDNVVIHLMQLFDLGPEVFKDLAHFLATGTFLEASGASPHMATLIKEAHESTWFTTDGLPGCVHAAIGSRAGDPLGDIAYNYLAACVHSRCEDRLTAEGLIFTIPPCFDDDTDVVKLVDNLYVDDGNFYGADPCS